MGLYIEPGSKYYFDNGRGAHDGTSLLETYIADIANVWKSVICIGTGNEGYAAGHTAGVLRRQTSEMIELAVGEYETAFNIQIWKSYLDEVDITLISPGGRRAGPIQKVLGAQRFLLSGVMGFHVLPFCVSE